MFHETRRPKMGKQTQEVTVTVSDEGEVLYTAVLTGNKGSEKVRVQSVVSPNVNLKSLSEMFRVLGEAEEHNYYMGRVKTLSADAREAIKKALGDDDAEVPFPF
jgi:hypothetical protein